MMRDGEVLRKADMEADLVEYLLQGSLLDPSTHGVYCTNCGHTQTWTEEQLHTYKAHTVGCPGCGRNGRVPWAP